MKKLVFTLLAAAATAGLGNNAVAQGQLTGAGQLSGHGFTDDGQFNLTVSGPADLEVSQDLHSWTKYTTVTQPTTLHDINSKQADHRFYRMHGSSNVIGYLKVTVPPGKFALLGNSFDSSLRLDTPEGRQAVFGVPNPAVKISLHNNGNFVTHTFDPASGQWNPAFKGVKSQEGFGVQNTGTTPLTVRLGGPVRVARVQTTIPAGSSVLSSPFPTVSPVAQLQGGAVQDGTQVQWFDEQSQAYKTSTFDMLEKPGKWMPPLPTLPPGHAVVIKSPKATTLTNSLPAIPAR